jgi:hypothetical protein
MDWVCVRTVLLWAYLDSRERKGAMGTGGSFPAGKMLPGRAADQSPPSSAEVKKE